MQKVIIYDCYNRGYVTLFKNETSKIFKHAQVFNSPYQAKKHIKKEPRFKRKLMEIEYVERYSLPVRKK